MYHQALTQIEDIFMSKSKSLRNERESSASNGEVRPRVKPRGLFYLWRAK